MKISAKTIDEAMIAMFTEEGKPLPAGIELAFTSTVAVSQSNMLRMFIKHAANTSDIDLEKQIMIALSSGIALGYKIALTKDHGDNDI